MAEQAQKPQQPQTQPKPTPAPQAKPQPVDRDKLAAEMAAMLDPKNRYVVIDSESFTVVLVSMLQIRDSELSTALLRRRQDFATNE